MTETVPPLLVTLTMDEASFGHFNGLRLAHFPPERNKIPAHITLFHHLPGAELPQVTEVMRRAAKRPVFPMATDGLMFLGGGVAYTIASPEAHALRRELADSWEAWLTPQDKKRPFRPHITIQNKVEADSAKALFQALQANFQPNHLTAIGLDLWFYQGGPWQHQEFFPFQ